jgi:hypothetical protein
MTRAAPLAALLLLYLLLVLPDHPGLLTAGALAVFPLELPVILVLLLAVPRALAVPLRTALAIGLTATTALKLADIAAQSAYLRPFNPVLDLGLVPAAWRMLSGAAGAPAAFAAAVALTLALAATAAGVWWAAGRIANVEIPRIRPALAVVALPALALAVGPSGLPGAASTSHVAWTHARDAWQAHADLARFRAEAAADAYAALPPDAILPGLRGTDVLLVFVESYGRSALTNPRYAPAVAAALQDGEAGLRAAGLAARSAFLAAPVIGGQSWLARATLSSGLWTDNQARYQALLASPRRTLMHLARAAGWQTVAVMPAIAHDWPEAGYFGYDRVLAARDLGYRGVPFNWVTMPDQFTLSAFERIALAPAPRPPVFAEIALISSHAPWTPVPPVLPWDAVGDGRAFDRFATAGDPPEVVWRDPERIRDQYRQALAYSLRAVTGFAARRPALIVMLGDHQPVPLVSEQAGADVPVHVIGSPAALARLDGWSWTPGLVPAPDAPVWRMDAFRDRFLAAFADRPREAAALGPSPPP